MVDVCNTTPVEEMSQPLSAAEASLWVSALCFSREAGDEKRVRAIESGLLAAGIKLLGGNKFWAPGMPEVAHGSTGSFDVQMLVVDSGDGTVV